MGFGVRIESAVSTEATPWPKRFWKCLQHSRKHQSISRGTCGAPANAKKFSEALAGLPQTPKSFSRDLRDSRKRQKVFRETCGTPANAKKFFVGLATVLQAFPKALWPLQRAIQDHLYGLGTPFPRRTYVTERKITREGGISTGRQKA